MLDDALAMAVLITSSSAMLQFLLIGYLRWDYTVFFMSIGVVGTFIGQTAVNYAVRKYGRTSLVVFAVVIIMALAILLMSINGIIELVDGVLNELQFNSDFVRIQKENENIRSITNR